MNAGIYIIFNSVTDHFYIGRSSYVEERWRNHRGALRRGKHHNRLLQEAWNLHGEEAFDCFILQTIDRNDPNVKFSRGTLLSAEYHWIEKLQPEYNVNFAERMAEVGRERRKKSGNQPKKPRPKRYQPKKWSAEVPDTLKELRKCLNLSVRQVALEYGRIDAGPSLGLPDHYYPSVQKIFRNPGKAQFENVARVFAVMGIDVGEAIAAAVEAKYGLGEDSSELE
jgi:GIY-YIG catalytic domain